VGREYKISEASAIAVRNSPAAAPIWSSLWPGRTASRRTVRFSCRCLERLSLTFVADGNRDANLDGIWFFFLFAVYTP
jgi:hypothetical protein